VDNILPTVDKHRLKIQNKTASTFAIGRFSRGFRLRLLTRAPLISAGESLLFQKGNNLTPGSKKGNKGSPKEVRQGNHGSVIAGKMLEQHVKLASLLTSK
jgi:hypothetical protein